MMLTSDNKAGPPNAAARRLCAVPPRRPAPRTGSMVDYDRRRGRRPHTLRFDDLMHCPKTEVASVHQCCGNPFAPFEPTRRVCNVRWGGTRLGDVLASCRGLLEWRMSRLPMLPMMPPASELPRCGTARKITRPILTQIKRARLLLKEIEAHYKRVLELARLRPIGSIREVVLAVVGSAECNSPLVPAALRVSMMCQRRVGQLLKEA